MRILLPLALLLGCRESMVSTRTPDGNTIKAWGDLYERVVTDDGYVDYDLLESERHILDEYVAWLGTDEAWKGRTTKDWHARYLNVYNTLVLFQVLERGRPASVLEPRRILPIDGAAFFVETQFNLGENEWLSLSEIEHERIRQKELDIRDHAAINCASMSCPPLPDQLYRPVALHSQLDDQMTRWVMDEQRGLRIEPGRVLFNPIFEWYARDFEFWTAGLDLCAIAAQYATGKRQSQLQALSGQGCPHAFFEYDWRLNDVHNAR